MRGGYQVHDNCEDSDCDTHPCQRDIFASPMKGQAGLDYKRAVVTDHSRYIAAKNITVYIPRRVFSIRKCKSL